MRKALIITILIIAITYAVQDNTTQVINPQISGIDLSIPKSINFQGYLYRNGTPMDTTMDMWFGIYDAQIGGSQLFQQTINNVTVNKGWFTVTLDNISNSVFPVGGPTRFLEVKAPSTGPSLLPRIYLVSVGYSYHALTTDTAEYAKVAPLTRPITPLINGNEIAMPCSLQGSVALPSAILNIRNNGGGRGIIIDRVGGHGIYIDSTPAGSGLYINKTNSYGIAVDSSGGSGVYVNKSHLNGLQVNDAARHGVRINQADSCGLYINSANRDGVKVHFANNNGVYIDSANYTGVYVKRADDWGFKIDRAGINGVSIGSVNFNGIDIDSAGAYGVYIDRSEAVALYVFGKTAGGRLMADSPNGIGLIAVAYNGVSTDTAIRAYGKGIASGGWSSEFDDGKEAPCIVGSDRTIIVSGTAKLSDGKVEIFFPTIFTENIRTDIPVRLSLTPIDESSGLLLVSRNKTKGFLATLKRIPGWEGNDDITFDWIAIGTLKEPETSTEAKAEWEKAIKERETRRREKADRRLGDMK